MRKKNNETICKLVPIFQKIVFLFLYLFLSKTFTYLQFLLVFFFFPIYGYSLYQQQTLPVSEGMVNSFLPVIDFTCSRSVCQFWLKTPSLQSHFRRSHFNNFIMVNGLHLRKFITSFCTISIKKRFPTCQHFLVTSSVAGSEYRHWRILQSICKGKQEEATE